MKHANENYYIFYDLADEDNQQRIITNDGVIDTIDKYDHKYKKYDAIQMKFLDCDPNNDVLKEYLKFF
jgi:hypothetical protein